MRTGGRAAWWRGTRLSKRERERERESERESERENERERERETGYKSWREKRPASNR